MTFIHKQNTGVWWFRRACPQDMGPDGVSLKTRTRYILSPIMESQLVFISTSWHLNKQAYPFPAWPQTLVQIGTTSSVAEDPRSASHILVISAVVPADKC